MKHLERRLIAETGPTAAEKLESRMRLVLVSALSRGKHPRITQTMVCDWIS